MSKKLNWLDKFAQEQAEKGKLNKTASLNKKAEQAVVDADQLPTTEEGAVVELGGVKYRVVNANFSDAKGPGVLIEKVAELEEEVPVEGEVTEVPATDDTTTPVAPMGAPAAGGEGQQYFRTKLPIEETYNNDQDAQFGQSSAPATAQEIAGEDATDRTTVPGHYTKSPGLNTTPDGGASIPVNPNAQVIGYPPVGPGAGSGSVTPSGVNGPEGAAAPMTTPTAPATDSASQTVDPNATVVAPGANTSPAVTEGPSTPAAAPVAPATDATTTTDETTEDEDADKADKLASNRILARIFKNNKR